MKTIIIITGLAVAFSFSACHHEQAPEKIKTAFDQKYPDAEEVEWEMEHGKWEAEFEVDEKEMEALFDENGNWIETETEMEDEDLPDAVKQTLKNQFKDYEVEEAEYLESPEYSGYEIELEGNKDIEVVIGKNGQVLKQGEEEEDDDD